MFCCFLDYIILHIWIVVKHFIKFFLWKFFGLTLTSLFSISHLVIIVKDFLNFFCFAWVGLQVIRVRTKILFGISLSKCHNLQATCFLMSLTLIILSQFQVFVKSFLNFFKKFFLGWLATLCPLDTYYNTTTQEKKQELFLKILHKITGKNLLKLYIDKSQEFCYNGRL